MKKFLKDLEKELKRLNLSDEEISEILADHAEMIETALEEGLSEDELSAKFGDPQVVAKELKDMSEGEESEVSSDDDFLGFRVCNTFNVLEDSFSVNIKLVSEDIEIKYHDLESIIVHIKGKVDKFDISYANGTFELVRKKSRGIFRLEKSSKFKVFLPKKLINSFLFANTSGDAEIFSLSAEQSKITTVSGDIELFDISIKEVAFNAVSGDILINNGTFGTMNCNTVSGDYEFKNTTIEKDIDLKAVSGDYEFENVTSASLNFKSISGDLDATEFYTEEISLNTISGDIDIENKDKERVPTILKKKSLSGTIEINGAKQ